MELNFNEIKSLTDEALMISTVKMLVFKELKDELMIDEKELKDKINSKPNDFYKPEELDILVQDNFNDFIKKLVDLISEEIK
ncbi:MAG: hypothetical protein KAU20_01670 [Nanoarchaeota archaeon]|nr:hypothetical protein [Nanoarchaeota archaeon]